MPGTSLHSSIGGWDEHRASPLSHRRATRLPRLGETAQVARVIRLAVEADCPTLQRMEIEAGQRYREHGLDHVADDEPPSVESLVSYISEGRAWTAVDESDHPVGYILVAIVDGAAHIEQVTVLPPEQGRGVGRALIETARSWASSRHLRGLTLTTFEGVPWNRPLYEHLGFRVMSMHEIGPELRRLREEEAARGLEHSARVAMWLDLLSDP